MVHSACEPTSQSLKYNVAEIVEVAVVVGVREAVAGGRVLAQRSAIAIGRYAGVVVCTRGHRPADIAVEAFPAWGWAGTAQVQSVGEDELSHVALGADDRPRARGTSSSCCRRGPTRNRRRRFPASSFSAPAGSSPCARSASGRPPTSSRGVRSRTESPN
eukprot:scaffold66598_cov66-Phaeocystis_antarctica.AAC.5